MKTGEHWYAMQDPEGNPQGYARLVVTDVEKGTQRVDWELHLAFPGGTYEEARSAVHDAEGRMLAASYRDDSTEVDAERQGDRIVGRVRRGGDEVPVDLTVEDEALSGMGFVLAADLPREVGFEREHADYNEAQGFAPEGRCVLGVRGAETLARPDGDVPTWKMVLRRASGGELPLWIDDEGRIVQTDWGGGNLMVLSETSTEHLFDPTPDVVTQVTPDDASTLVVEGVIEGASPEEVFAWWTDAERLPRWWSQEAAVGDAVGGDYVLSWPQVEWTLRGTITAWDPGHHLGFSWAWDHMQEKPPLQVEVTFEPAEGGTKLRIVHGPYEDSDADRKERDGHWEGWRSVTARLQAALDSGD